MNEIEPKLIRADVLMDHLEKMHKVGILQSMDDIRFAIMDAPEVMAIPIEKVKLSFNKENGTKDKAIIVIDMPINCFQCQFCRTVKTEDGFIIRCMKKMVENPDFHQEWGPVPYTKPRWCPLAPLPTKRDLPPESNSWYDLDIGFAHGWNECLSQMERLIKWKQMPTSSEK